MSNITIKPNDSGIGEIKITGPNTNDTRYQLLPDVSGNVVVSDGSLLTVSHSANEVKFGGRTEITGVPKGLHKWEIVSSNTTLTVNRNYFANTRGQSDLTLTLPASANVGDTIQVIDNEGFCSSNNIFIANGTSTQTIDGGVRKLTLTTDRESVKLFYTGTGWVSKQQETELRTTVRSSNFGFAAGGYAPPFPSVGVTIDKYPFASDSNATDVGDLSRTMNNASGTCSETNGYVTVDAPSAPIQSTDRFPFASDADGVATNDLTVQRLSGASASSLQHGYHIGGYAPPPISDVIDKFPFASDTTNFSDVGNLTQARTDLYGVSSFVSGYALGGTLGPPDSVNTIDKFPFATDTNATDVGDLTGSLTKQFGGNNSETHGYRAGGGPGVPVTDTIDKFPFSNDTNATDIANLHTSASILGSSNSKVFGYNHGGYTPPGNRINNIQKFPFVSDVNGTDVANLSVGRSGPAGLQG